MTKKEFQNFISGRIVFLDGATGINLIKAGMPKGVCPEKWILENPDVIVSLQSRYIESGSEIIYAPTFTANRIKLKEYGLESRIKEINIKLAKLARKPADGKALVAGDLTMTGQLLKPLGELKLEELIDVYKEQISYLVEGGVDLLVVETMTSLAETRAALIAASEVCDLPMMASLTFEVDGRTLYGTDPKTAAIVLKSLGAAAIGVNCGAGPDQMIGIIREMAEVVDLPLIAKPNAGLPILDATGQTVYNLPEKEFAESMLPLIEAGATLIGGCCGTTPDYIKILTANYGKMTPKNRKMTENRHLSSERKTLSFGLNDPFIIVGERINPTGKKKLKEELKNGCLDLVCSFAEEQETAGASILDVNMGMEGIDEKEMMRKALSELSVTTSLPLAIDSSNPQVIETALRNYPGRALINSISLEKIKFDEILPLAKKYGAMFILLPLSDAGLPADINEKIDIIEKITTRAIELGIPKEDIIVDALVTTIGANKNAALEAIETIKYCKEKGYPTICGLSNISFGLPERGYINTAFLTMAVNAGLTMAIMNPEQTMAVNNVMAVDMLLNRDGADLRYIDHISQHAQINDTPVGVVTPDRPQTPAGVDTLIGTQTPATQVKTAVLKGQRTKIIDLVKTTLESGLTPKEILDNYLLPAINEVGILFDKGTYFLPQLIASAETMKTAIEYLEPMLKQTDSGTPSVKIIIATVAGDIHDIGKNLVALMLKNHGYEVIDLGKDVASTEIINQAKAHQADIIALSALMTTTMTEMKNVVTLAKENNLTTKIIIGGAVITAEYAAEIGASGYAKDAAEAVRLVQGLL